MPLTSWWNSSQRHVFPFLFSNLIQEQVQSGFSLKTHIRAQSKSQSHLPVKSILYSEFFLSNTELTFLLVTCLQPSIGAGAVWMGLPLRGWIQIPAMKNGDHLKVPYHSVTLPGRWISWKNARQKSRSTLKKKWSASLRV